MKFNIPRVPVDQTDNLTEYEFEYEMLLEEAYLQWLDAIRNNRPVEEVDGKFSRQFAMDEDDYQRIVELSESDEYIDFGIPADAPQGRRLSEKYASNDATDFEPVDPSEVFRGKDL